jgi:sugar phosphate permease
MVVLGSLMHRVSLRLYVIGGLAISSLAYMFWIVLYAVTGFYHPALMTILMCINGFFQATGWPGLMAIFSLWFADHKKGLLMGVWALNANVGNIIAESLLNVLTDHDVYFVWNFVLTGGLGLGVALMMAVFLKEKPELMAIDEEHDVEKSLIEDPTSQT